MKVKILKDFLKDCDDNDEVILSRDEEGNGFSPLADAEKVVYVADSSYSGDIYIRELTEDFEKMGYTKEDVYRGKGGKKAILLWPTH